MSIQLTLTTPEGVRLEDEVEFLKAPGSAGDIGVLPGHSPLLSSLEMGVVTITRAGGKREHYAISGGFIEVRQEELLLLAETSEAADDIDVERAKAAKERAEERLQDPGPDIDIPRAELAIERALNRLRVADEGA